MRATHNYWQQHSSGYHESHEECYVPGIGRQLLPSIITSDSTDAVIRKDFPAPPSRWQHGSSAWWMSTMRWCPNALTKRRVRPEEGACQLH